MNEYHSVRLQARSAKLIAQLISLVELLVLSEYACRGENQISEISEQVRLAPTPIGGAVAFLIKCVLN